MEKLIAALGRFGIKGAVEKVNRGPLITQIVFVPAPGTKIKNISAALSDIAREIGANSLRAEPIPDSNAVGFELPTDDPRIVDLGQILAPGEFDSAAGALPICLGVDIAGNPVFADLAKMPHLLVAGTTGSGKSAGLNAFILSLIKRLPLADLRFILIDPKRVEFQIYDNQKYMLRPVITDNAEAARALAWLVGEMEDRYSALQKSACKNITDYNARRGESMPYIVCVIDEFADLIMTDKKAGSAIMLLTQKARAAGIHIILATQRPSVNIVTGALKANFPARLSFKVASMTDSRTILDRPGAERLIGRGDSLFLAPDGSLRRVHGAFIDDNGIAEILRPFAGAVPAVAPVVEATLVAKPEPMPRPGKSAARLTLDTWNALPKRTKSKILAGAGTGILWLLKKLLFGKRS